LNWGNLSSGLLGGVIGAVLATLGAWLIERALWARDNRKQEWRQLLDAVSEVESAIASFWSTGGTGSERVKDSLKALIGALNDRLFIADRDVVKLRGAVEAIRDEDLPLDVDAVWARQRCGEVRRIITDAARRNLGLGSPIHLSWKRRQKSL